MRLKENNMSGFTPGPWELNREGMPLVRWDMRPGCYGVWIPDESYPAMKEDARLMHAAPLMIKALQNLIKGAHCIESVAAGPTKYTLSVRTLGFDPIEEARAALRAAGVDT